MIFVIINHFLCKYYDIIEDIQLINIKLSIFKIILILYLHNYVPISQNSTIKL
jgi:hypothetical protein